MKPHSIELIGDWKLHSLRQSSLALEEVIAKRRILVKEANPSKLDDRFLRDFLVLGMNSDHVRKECFKEGNDLTFSKAREIIVSFAAVFSVVTQRSSPQTAAHIRTTFLSYVSTNHHSGYIFRELCAPKKSNQSLCLFHLGVHSFQNSDP